MAKVILTKGLPGSGKTTWAKAMQTQYPGQYIRINKDDLRAMLHNNITNDDALRTAENEALVVKARFLLLDAALATGRDIILDDTNLKPDQEAELRTFIGDRATIEIQDFTQVPLEECLKRNLQRKKVVKEAVIQDMYDQFIHQPSSSEK